METDSEPRWVQMKAMAKVLAREKARGPSLEYPKVKKREPERGKASDPRSECPTDSKSVLQSDDRLVHSRELDLALELALR